MATRARARLETALAQQGLRIRGAGARTAQLTRRAPRALSLPHHYKPQTPIPALLFLSPRAHGSNVHDITLSYTFYRVDDADSELAAAGDGGGGGARVHTWTAGPLPGHIKLAPGAALPPGVEVGGGAAGGGAAAAAATAAEAAAADAK